MAYIVDEIITNHTLECPFCEYMHEETNESYGGFMTAFEEGKGFLCPECGNIIEIEGILNA